MKFFYCLILCTWTIKPIKASINMQLQPENVVFADTLIDEMSMTFFQTVSISVQNVGKFDIDDVRAQLKIDNLPLTGYLYGPDSKGALIGGPIAPGETGKIVVSRPVGSYRHCQTLRVQMDSRQISQENFNGVDTMIPSCERKLLAFEKGNKRTCFVVNNRPFPRQF